MLVYGLVDKQNYRINDSEIRILLNENFDNPIISRTIFTLYLLDYFSVVILKTRFSLKDYITADRQLPISMKFMKILFFIVNRNQECFH